MVGIFNTKPHTAAFPTKIPLPKGEESFPYLDCVFDEFSFRGGFDLIFPAPDWENYSELLGKANTEIYSAIVERY